MAMLGRTLRSKVNILKTHAPSAMFSSLKKDASHVGFVGLGNMGAPMAANLAKFGHRLVVHDVDPERSAEFAKVFPGATAAKTPREVAASSRVVITMLPGAKQVRDVYLDPADGIFKESGPRSLFIDSSTIEPAIVKDLAMELEKRSPGATFVDAPVSGGVPGAKNRGLTFMVGCREDKIGQLESLLLCMGKKIVSCGHVGAGQVAKMCNNLILGVSMMGVCEAMALASRLGMDAKPLTDVINVSSGRCWTTDTYHPVPGVMDDVPSSRNYENGFACDLMLKDLGIAIAESKRVNANAPVALLVSALYRTLSEKGLGKKDFSAIYQDFYLNREFESDAKKNHENEQKEDKQRVKIQAEIKGKQWS